MSKILFSLPKGIKRSVQHHAVGQEEERGREKERNVKNAEGIESKSTLANEYD